MVTLQDLPDEVLCMIVDQLEGLGSTRDLARIVQVDRRWNSIATPQLYATVAFFNDVGNSSWWTNMRKFGDFATTVFRSPHIARLVRSLYIEHDFCCPINRLKDDLQIDEGACHQWTTWEGNRAYFEARNAALFPSSEVDRWHLDSLWTRNVAHAVLLLVLTALPNLRTLHVELQSPEFWYLFEALMRSRDHQPDDILQHLENVSLDCELRSLTMMLGDVSFYQTACYRLPEYLFAQSLVYVVLRIPQFSTCRLISFHMHTLLTIRLLVYLSVC